MYLVLNRVAKWTIFVLIGQGLKASAAHLYQNFFWMPPPPPTGGAEQYSPKYSTVYYTTFFYLFWNQGILMLTRPL